MSNVYKSNFVNQSKSERRVIDSNERVMTRLEAIKEQMLSDVAQENLSGLDPGIVGELVDPDNLDANIDDPDRIQSDMEVPADIEFMSAKALDIERKANERAAQIIHDAKEEADSIINNAQIKAKDIRDAAHKEGFESGVKESTVMIQNKIDSVNEQYEADKASLEEEYEQLKARLEPQLVDVLLTVFQKVTGAIADTNKGVILHLVEAVMRNSEISRDFLIRVSPDDYQFMLNNTDRLYQHASHNVRIEITEDNNMKRNQCIIETDMGVFDCSLDIQLENLSNEIRLLSCVLD
ncbi:MAG: hypothetical protein K6F17_02075 [Lachnospiraceae bacterium]|nr:hypothetical protein [Lachnospiraceae bacterium]